MILGGDEFMRTQKGNNNAYCQDNEISWFQWDEVEKNLDIFNFFKKAVAFDDPTDILRLIVNGDSPLMGTNLELK